MNLEQFKKEKIQAMKAHDNVKVAALNTIISKLMLLTIELRAQNKEVTDADVLKVLQKCEKELIEEREGFIRANRTEKVEELTKNIEIITAYLPKMLSDEEIKNVIASLEDKTTPSVMKHFKTNYAGKVDMKKVSEILKSLQ